MVQQKMTILHTFLGLLLLLLLLPLVDALAGNNGVKTRSFLFSPKSSEDKPKLVLIAGCPGTGKSTFGMSVALDQGILKCISTDTVRAVMRSFIPVSISPALHRSSYDGNDNDPVKSWRETCTVLDTSLEGLIDDAIHRNVGLVLEGVSLEPKSSLIDKWEKAGGVAIGCLLTVSDEKTHRKLLAGRGMLGTGQQEKDEKKLANFERIRMIQDEMIRLAQESKWQMIEQKIEPDPLEIIANKLIDTECRIDFHSEVSKEQLSDGDSSMVEEQFANENATNADHDAQLFE